MAGLILAAVALAMYVSLRGWRRRRFPDLGDVFILVSTITGALTGVRLSVVAITASAAELPPFTSEDRIFIPLAGVALVLVSAHEAYKVFARGALGHGRPR
ncbi:MAG TPA: hypothetical protein VFR97_15190 [Capillimicrobium sp.]|nr:hypothetical protein [Capillimicrobium sp.]